MTKEIKTDDRDLSASVEHLISHENDHRVHGGCCHRTRCTCGWGSDCYTVASDAGGAGEVHVRKARREDFDGLLARSSIGAAIADVKTRGIEAHLVDLEREMHRPRRPKAAITEKPAAKTPRART